MSRIHRVVEKAEREGQFSRTPAVIEAPHLMPRAHGTPEPAAATEEPPAVECVVPPSPTSDQLLVVVNAPTSVAAERFRLLRTRLAARDRVRRVQTLLVTSPLNGEGKTVTAANLALSMAQELQGRVLLVDADLRRPSVGPLLGLSHHAGLSDVVLGRAPLEHALSQVPGTHLTVLLAGERTSRPAELVGSSAMRRTIDTLRSQFDRIVIDTTPVALADTHVLASLADGILMVVRSGVTPHPAVERALGAFDREKLLGLILNGVDETPENLYGYDEPGGLAAAG